jgi:hypothetical protein
MQALTTLRRWAPARTARCRGWRVAGRAVLVALAIGVVPCMAPASASADPPACPASPAAYGGSDPVVSELRELRAEQVQACEALSDQLAQLKDDTADLAYSDDLVHDVNLATIAETVLPIHVEDPQLHADNAAAPAIGTVELGPDAREQLDNNTTAVREDYWWFFGILGGGLVVFLFWRIMRPSAS